MFQNRLEQPARSTYAESVVSISPGLSSAKLQDLGIARKTILQSPYAEGVVSISPGLGSAKRPYPGIAGSPGIAGFGGITLVFWIQCLLVAIPIFADSTTHIVQGDHDTGIWQNIELQDMTGRSWTSKDLLGKVVILDFWATWCTPCLAELPHLRRMYDEHPDHLVILGIALDAVSRADLRSFLHRHHISWSQIHEAQGFGSPLAEQWQVETLPSLRIIDPKGRLVASNLRGRALELVVTRLVESASQVAVSEETQTEASSVPTERE